MMGEEDRNNDDTFILIASEKVVRSKKCYAGNC
jgi:hypothetical protein